ncbi:Ubiquinone/menaquinone biosynthesis C-methyltransferase UbiE [Streptomyces sp. AVP053U2]|nr:Ubiquinone/menaquinone biosynthesis C-methyltransferase UbiE [Streptomyces sp. AVP053U2]
MLFHDSGGERSQTVEALAEAEAHGRGRRAGGDAPAGARSGGAAGRGREAGAPARRAGCKNGAVTRASLDKQPHEVASMFDNVAARYDLTNDVLSLGQDRIWRKEVAKAVGARPAEKVLDLAAGTATSSLPFAQAGAYVVPCDFSLGMLQVGKQRRSWLPCTAGDATRLPFKDDVFDAVTISFGLRNVQDTDAALREMHRVTRPGGRLVICEFSQPTWAPFRTVYTEYLMRALPPVARSVSSNPDAYVYLAESIREWPDQPALAERLQGAGWTRVAWRNLTGGVVALHRGHKAG